MIDSATRLGGGWRIARRLGGWLVVVPLSFAASGCQEHQDITRLQEPPAVALAPPGGDEPTPPLVPTSNDPPTVGDPAPAVDTSVPPQLRQQLQGGVASGFASSPSYRMTFSLGGMAPPLRAQLSSSGQ